jgi:hypothetical protein
MTRYPLRCTADGVEIYDAETGDVNTAETVFGPASWDSASRRAHELNGYSFLSRVRDLEHASVVACPDCARYRRALNEIARTAGEQHVLRAANEALDTIGGNDG